ncbi:NAD(P)/FAD-dependent oxidoreductase [Actinomycetes bacterium KLBMP 9797]
MTNVLVIGGGIGGLCLAQGLRRAGVDVTVYERTHSRDDWLQGYRIHINPRGNEALRDCLAPENWQAFLRTVSHGESFAFVTEDLRDLLVLDPEFLGGDPDPAHQHYGVSRIKLREVLLTGLDGVVRHGKVFERYERTADGRVVAHFADGSSAVGDLLVGADGANSRVRGQLLPHARRLDTGVITIAGKYFHATGADLPPELTARVNNVLPAGRGSLFTAVWRADDGGDYTLWGYADAAGQFPGLDQLGGAELRDLVHDKIGDWHPALRRLVAASDPDTVNAIRIRSATPVEPWPTGPVTLLGDAIHNMTPMAGIGANTALRDASLLCRQLIAVRDGRAGLVPAVREYERQMIDYGFAAVKQSLRNAKQAANPRGRRVFRTVLRTAAAVPSLKRAMFGKIGQ